MTAAPPLDARDDGAAPVPGDSRDEAAQRRDAAADVRDDAAEERDDAGHQRDEAATLRDVASQWRDLLAARRDVAADRRDADAARHEAASDPRFGTADGDAARQSGVMARRDAAADRQRSSQDRQAGASERTQAGQDRVEAQSDRGSGAGERDQAGLDRGTALTDRGASAQDREDASLDGLTGAYVRGPGLLQLARELVRAQRTGELLTVAFVDVDHLKAVNDAGGHAAGDALLVRVAQALRRRLRPYDLVVRYGGDEFVCVLTGLDAAAAEQRLAQVNVDLSGHGSVTVGAVAAQQQDSPEVLVRRADAAMYVRRANRRQL